MYKHIDVGSWDFGMKTAEIIPVSSRGLTASDGRSFFEKRAGSHQFRDVLDRIKLTKDEVPIHLIAMGTTESFGENKNSDGFKRAMLKETHPTFVSNAHVFYHHDNNDPKNAFGKVAASTFNDEMDRVELLILLNGSKEAAEKNGGKVAPKEDVDALYAGKELPWSMGISVPWDECCFCRNKAASPKTYCEEHECIDDKKIQRFGCKHGLGKVAEAGASQYVDNPVGKFKDISRVSTPADRTAYGAIAKYAALAGENLGGAQLALARGYFDEEDIEHTIKPAAVQGYSVALTKLAQVEAALRPVPEVLAASQGFKEADALPALVLQYAERASDRDKYAYLMHLADFKIVLSPKQFAKYAGFNVTAAYPKAVCGMFGQLDRAHDNRVPLLNACSKYAGVRQLSLPAYHSLFPLANYYTDEATRDRIISGTMSGETKTANTAIAPNETDLQAAVEYCLYKIAVVTRLNDENHYVTACVQNF